MCLGRFMPEMHARMVESVQTKSKRYPAVKTYLQRYESSFCIVISTKVSPKVKFHRHSTIETPCLRTRFSRLISYGWQPLKMHQITRVSAAVVRTIVRYT